MGSFHLEIITPDKPFFSEDIDRVIVKTLTGDLAVLKSRAPLFTILKEGKIRISYEKKEKAAEIGAGYLNIDENNATIVTNSAQWLSDPDASDIPDMSGIN